MLSYPKTKRGDVVDDLHGVKVADPYRWLEDPDSAETQEWVKQQNEVTNTVLKNCENRDNLFGRLKELHNYPKYRAPSKRGDKYFYWYNTGLQNQHVLYVQETLTSAPSVFLNPNELKADGTASIGSSKFSKSGSNYAYSVHNSGSDWQEIRFKPVPKDITAPKPDLPDVLKWVKFSGVAWDHKELGVFYCRYPAPKSLEGTHESIAVDKRGTETDKAEQQRVFFHRLGTDQSEDILIYEDSQNPNFMFGVEVTDDGKFLVITVSSDCERKNKFYLLDISNADSYTKTPVPAPYKWKDAFEAEYSYITNDGPIFYLQTNLNAPRNRLVAVDIMDPKAQLKEIIPQTEAVLQWTTCINNKFIVNVMKDVQENMKAFDMSGNHLFDFELPTIGSISEVTGERESKELFFQFVSFLHPGVIFHYDFEQKKQITFRQIEVKNFDPSLFETKQVFYESHDKVKIPMFIIHKKGIELNGENPTLLYGYGGFNISLTPSFSVARVIFLRHFEGVYAIANLRGGDEYGEDWHQGGILDRKQNVFEDFKYAARTLTSLKYSKPSKIAIMGGSNGGLLVAACVNQNPELFGVGVAQVGVLDMLRFHKFTIGYAWCSDYGNADQPNDFKYLYKYSPYHNVPEDKAFPALMLCTADHDDRVVPAHSFKYIAEVQHKLAGKDFQKLPLVIRVEVKAGHGHGKPMEKIIEESADTWAFITHYLSAKWKD